MCGAHGISLKYHHNSSLSTSNARQAWSNNEEAKVSELLTVTAMLYSFSDKLMKFLKGMLEVA